MRHRHSLFLAVAAALLYAESPVSAAPAADVTQESPRERNRVLLKRNPIASEYQEKGRLGLAPGGAADAEGVDFRSQFRMSSLPAGQTRFGLDLSGAFQESSGDLKPGGAVTMGRAWQRAAGQVRLGSTAARRFVSHYQSRWLVDRAIGGEDDLDIPGFLRYSEDHYDTTNLSASWRFDWQPVDALSLRYEGLASDYEDEAYRNRLEFQTPGAQLGNVTAVSSAGGVAGFDALDARIRRYFHIMATSREIDRHLAQATLSAGTETVELSVYHSNWQNTRDWSPWNFIDTGVDTRISLDDPYIPRIEAINGIDISSTDASRFANFRPSRLTTTDTDNAVRLDWDHASGGRYLTAGVLWREKARVAQHNREVYGATSSVLALSAVTGGNEATTILDGDFLLPAGLDVRLAEGRVISAPESFGYSAERSFLETLQDEFESTEEVLALYVSLERQREQWRWQAALRYEETDVETLGAVSGPASALTGIEGERVTRIVSGDRIIEETFASFDAYRVPGSASYRHWIPTLGFRYEPRPTISVRGAWYRSLMRPQYFDVVRYRRINPPTRSINEGNPSLDATVIDNLSLGLEWTSGRLGKIAVELYHKDIADFFFDARSTELLDGVSYEVSRVENGKSGDIQGFQLQWDRGFSERVAWLDRLDVSLAYTFSESEGDLGSRSIAMPERSRHLLQSSVNVVWHHWRYRMDLSWQDSALDEVGESAITDQFREEVVIFNHTLTRGFGERWQARLQVINILDFPERSYEGEGLRVTNNQFSDFSVVGSLSLRL